MPLVTSNVGNDVKTITSTKQRMPKVLHLKYNKIRVPCTDHPVARMSYKQVNNDSRYSRSYLTRTKRRIQIKSHKLQMRQFLEDSSLV